MGRYTFQDKVALITGGSRGLGLQIARELCRRGAKVSLLARDADELASAKNGLERFKTDVLTVQCDLTESQQIQSAVRETLQRFRKIDILINDAGIIEVGPIEHSQLKDFDRNMRVHFWAPYILYLLIAPHMRAQRGGRIVNISSIGGRIGVPHMAAYCASKFALAGFSDAARAELARDNIYVTTVTPGLMRTGSHIHANFKGDHAAEYKSFRRALKIPFASISIERAARKIVSACKGGRPALVMPFTTYLAIVANAVFPNITARVLKLVNRGLAGPVSQEGNEARSGMAIRSGK